MCDPTVSPCDGQWWSIFMTQTPQTLQWCALGGFNKLHLPHFLSTSTQKAMKLNIFAYLLNILKIPKAHQHSGPSPSFVHLGGFWGIKKFPFFQGWMEIWRIAITSDIPVGWIFSSLHPFGWPMLQSHCLSILWSIWSSCSIWPICKQPGKLGSLA